MEETIPKKRVFGARSLYYRGTIVSPWIGNEGLIWIIVIGDRIWGEDLKHNVKHFRHRKRPYT